MELKGKIKWMKYVVHEDVRTYELTGWIVVADLGEHSVLMEWVQDGDPVMPDDDSRIP